jgi:hypothetical protein
MIQLTVYNYNLEQFIFAAEIAGHDCAVVEGSTLAPALQNMRRALMQAQPKATVLFCFHILGLV